MTFLIRLPAYFLPAVLIALEEILRNAMNQAPNPAIGASLAAASVGLLVPLTVVKKVDYQSISAELLKEIEKYGGTLVNKRDQTFVPIAWIFFLGFLVVWFYILYASNGVSLIFTLSALDLLWIGSVLYLAAIIMVEIKERI